MCRPRPARSASESFVHLFKGGRVQGRRPWPRSAERGTLLCSHKRRRGSKGEPSPGVPPFIYSWVCACAPIRWAVVATPCCLSTPFLWCLPKETVSSRQRKALFLPWWLHHSRERSCLGGLYSSSPDLGRSLVVDWALKSALRSRRGYWGFEFVGEAGGTEHLPWRHPKARFFGAPPRFFAQEQRNGVELAVGADGF